MLPKSARAACKSIVEKSDYALTNPTDAAALARVLREVKAHAASCLSTFDIEQQDDIFTTDMQHNQPRVTFDYGLDETKAHEVNEDDIYEPEPLEELATLTQADKTAFEAAHERLILVGFDNINISEQNDIVHAVLNEIEDHESLGYTADESNDFACIMTVDDLSTQKEDDHDTTKLVHEGESTRASPLNVAALLSEKVNTNLLVTLLTRGLECEQICSIVDTGATKPFVQSIRECIHYILVSIPESSKVTTATSVSSATSMSLRRYNFAITKDMVDTAKRIGLDISGADAITVLAPPLCVLIFKRDSTYLPATYSRT